jgi:hypothetical protein
MLEITIALLFFSFSLVGVALAIRVALENYTIYLNLRMQLSKPPIVEIPEKKEPEAGIVKRKTIAELKTPEEEDMAFKMNESIKSAVINKPL